MLLFLVSFRYRNVSQEGHWNSERQKDSFTHLCDKYGIHCHYCHKEGHWKSECPENPDRQQKMVEVPLDGTRPPRKRQRRRWLHSTKAVLFFGVLVFFMLLMLLMFSRFGVLGNSLRMLFLFQITVLFTDSFTHSLYSNYFYRLFRLKMLKVLTWKDVWRIFKQPIIQIQSQRGGMRKDAGGQMMKTTRMMTMTVYQNWPTAMTPAIQILTRKLSM